MKVEIREFQLGMYMTNCYLVWNENKEGYLFDCGGEGIRSIVDFVSKNGIQMKGVVLTHGHYDHIGGLNKVKEAFPEVIVYVGEEEKEFLTDHNLSLSEMIDRSKFKYLSEVKLLNEGDNIGGFTVISTPGHTGGSKCFYNKDSNILISGDTLFKRSFGRYDLVTGSEKELFRSLKRLCDELPPNTVVYSGHSSETTIGEEKEFLKMQGYID